MLKDSDIREPLFEFLEETFGKIRIIEEKIIGRSRADVVMVTENQIVGIEIKSDADTYTRLKTQVKDYDLYYDMNYIVVGSTHAMHVSDHVPEYWGIITVDEIDGSPDFYIFRKPDKNPKCRLQLQMRLLWRPEIAVIQLKYNMPKYKEKAKEFVIDKILERTKLPDEHKNKIDLEVLKTDISSILFERDYNNISQTLAEYRKSEIQKKIEKESDPEKQVQLLAEKIEKRRYFKKNKRKIRRRYR